MDYLKAEEEDYPYALMLLVLMFVNQSVYIISLSLMHSVSVHVGLKLLGALHYLGYCKLLTLPATNDTALAQFVSFLTTDHDRIQEAVSKTVMIINIPIMTLLSFTYLCYLAGPSALTGILIILISYPVMVKSSLH